MSCKYWEDKKFVKTVSESRSIKEVLKKFELPTNQGYYNKVFRNEVSRLNIDTSHFRISKKQDLSLEEILVENSPWKNGSNGLKRKLLKSGILKNQCSCGQGPEWKGKPLTLHLDHINGEPSDNRTTNLRILCPNCHTQTETYCGANKRRKARSINVCTNCGDQKKTSSPLCPKCSRSSPKEKKIEWPSVEYIKDRLLTTSFLQLGKELGVSDNAIRKHLKNR